MKKTKTNEKWFTVSGLKKTFHYIRWPKFWANKSTKTKNEKSTVNVANKVLAFTVFFALFFVAFDAVAAWLLKTM